MVLSRGLQGSVPELALRLRAGEEPSVAARERVLPREGSPSTRDVCAERFGLQRKYKVEFSVPFSVIFKSVFLLIRG